MFHRHVSENYSNFVFKRLVINEILRESRVYIGTFSEIVGRFHRHLSDFIKHELAINETSLTNPRKCLGSCIQISRFAKKEFVLDET